MHNTINYIKIRFSYILIGPYHSKIHYWLFAVAPPQTESVRVQVRRLFVRVHIIDY
jgi:hypothetical protein